MLVGNNVDNRLVDYDVSITLGLLCLQFYKEFLDYLKFVLLNNDKLFMLI